MKFLLWWGGKKQSKKQTNKKSRNDSNLSPPPPEATSPYEELCLCLAQAGHLPSSLLEGPQIILCTHAHACADTHTHTHLLLQIAKFQPVLLCCKFPFSSISLVETLYGPTLLPCFCLFKHFSHGRGQNFHYINEISTSRLKRKYALQSPVT